MFKIWVDDVRPMPEGYDIHFKSVWEFIEHLQMLDAYEFLYEFLIDLDHDAGDYERYGGDYINILKYLEFISNEHNDAEWVKSCITFKIHTANPPARQLMINIIERNQWKMIP